MSPNGWIILDKPLGLGSTQAVAAVKRNLREGGYGKVKVGHGGTLDPLATGVLPIALGEATKLAGRMLDASKVYEFAIGFGAETDTLDLEGKVIAESAVRPTLAEIAAELPRFTGPIEQVPPAYSALMVDGARAYDRARAGEAVELASRAVTIQALDLIASTAGSATLRAHVSKGTYIRSLARDIARALGTVGHVTMLRRTRAGPFGLDAAISLDILNAVGKGAALENVLLPLEAGLVDIPALTLGPEQASAVREGRVLTGLAFQDGVCWARSGDLPLALMQVEGGNARVLRGFNLPDVAE
ncbi:MAG: tRNA pseudouridine(55) synthase TruB [Novosphingobium sp.]